MKVEEDNAHGIVAVLRKYLADEVINKILADLHGLPGTIEYRDTVAHVYAVFLTTKRKRA